MEYYWKLRSKNAQNIKALVCSLQQHFQTVRIIYIIIKIFLQIPIIGSQFATKFF